jgi:hypothetical protein
MKGCTILVTDGNGRQILGIDTKYAGDEKIAGHAFSLPGGLFITVTPYTEIRNLYGNGRDVGC